MDDISVDRFEKILEGTSVSNSLNCEAFCVLCYRKSATWSTVSKGLCIKFLIWA